MGYTSNDLGSYFEQTGGELKTKNSYGSTGPKIDPTNKNIQMKIELVKDTGTEQTLPSYLIPELTCGGSKVDGSVVTMTLSGDALQKNAPSGFTCEITSNFLTGGEKSAITIETYYANSSDVVNNTNIIYFDESLLKYYKDTNGTLIQSDNPFLVNATTTTGGGSSYTFEFKFEDIIDKINKLPSYTQIQNMFKLVNVISTNPTACLVKISHGAFLNINFKGIPFDTSLSNKSLLKLTIDTKNNAVQAGCDLKSAIGSLDLTGNEKKVIILDYTFDLTKIYEKPKQPNSNSNSSPDSTGADAGKSTEVLQAEAELKAAQAELEAAQKNGDTAGVAAAQAKINAAKSKLTSLTTPSASAATNAVVGAPVISKVSGDISNIQNTIDQLVAKMNVLISQRNQGFATGPMILGAPGDTGACGKGGMELKSNGKDVTIVVPVSMIMSEIMSPTMLAEYSRGNAGKKRTDDQQPSPPPNADNNASRIVTPILDPNTPLSANQNATPDAGQNAGQNATPSGATIEIDQSKKSALDAAKAALNVLQQQISTKGISQTITDVELLEAAVKDAELAVTSFNAATDTAAAKTKAEGLIDKATGLVAQAQSAVKDAVQAKKQADEKAASDLAVKIGKLTDKLQNEAKKVLDDATKELSEIPQTAPPSTPQGELESAKQAIETAKQAIETAKTAIETAKTAIETAKAAADAYKTKLIKDAETAVQTAVDAAGKAKQAVEAAAAKPNPTGNTEPTFQDYQAAWTAYQEVKGKFKSATDALPQAGGAQPTEEQIQVAKAKLTKQVESINASLSTYTSIKELSDKEFTDLTDANAKQQQIDNLKAATNAYTDALSKIQDARAEYDAVIKPGDSSAKPMGAEDDASSAKTIQTYTEFYNKFQDCLVEKIGGDSSQEKVKDGVTNDKFIQKLTDCFKDSSYDGNVLQPFSNAVLTASLNSNAKKLNPSLQIQETENNNINHQLLLLIINNLAPENLFKGDKDKVNVTFEKLIEILGGDLTKSDSGLMQKIQSEYKGEEAGGFSLFDGGSKSSSSKSNSSSSKSKSKSKPKNKTKKNHSAPKSSKSKTPKIIMNE
jgi:hypothetical protein